MSSHGNPIAAPFTYLEGFGANTNVLLAVLGLGFAYLAFSMLNLGSSQVFGYVFATAPLWLPVTTFLLFFKFWLHYVQKEFDLAQGRVTLEIKLPQEIFKSPEAMELVLVQLHQTASSDNHVQTYYDGKHPPTFSLELVSRGGDVRFYISTPRKKFKNLLETQLYAQYPGIEVHELEIDYTAEIPWDLKRFSYFSIHFGLKKADAYPIKTYIEYGLNSMPKEEEKIDPISTMIEMLGSVGPGEHVWIQILISANRKVTFKEGALFESPTWTEEARGEIKNIFAAAEKRAGISSEKAGMSASFLITEAERDTIKAIERSLGKNAFNTAIRAMYIGKNDAYNPGERIGAIITSWRSYDDLNRNAIGLLWRTDFSWNWWQDPKDRKKNALKKAELAEYKNRTYTNYTNNDTQKVMTTEELATIFHLPGKVVATPSLARIPSKRSEPPANLPVG